MATYSTAGPATSSWSSYYAVAKHAPVYVVLGVQGSGTNFLRSILVSAFNFSVVQDQTIVVKAALKVGQNPSIETVQRQFAAIRSRLFPSTLTRKTRRRIKANAPFTGIEEHFDPTTIKSAADLAQFVFAYGAYSMGTTLMAIKSDDMWEAIDHLDTALPNRRIILLTRDFRDNLLSVTKKHFGPIEPLVAAQYVKDRFAHYDAEYRRTPPEHRFHVRYEDLLETPDAVVAGLRDHFKLGGDREAPPAVDKGRIRRNNKRKWASLSQHELGQCEAILRDALNAYGYGTECDPVDPPSPSEWLVAKGRDAVKRIPQKIDDVANRLRK
jgi:hypothetical protein